MTGPGWGEFCTGLAIIEDRERCGFERISECSVTLNLAYAEDAEFIMDWLAELQCRNSAAN